MKPSIFILSCANQKEAKKIGDALLKERIVICVKCFPVQSSFLWKGKKQNAREVLLVMESIVSNFKKAEDLVKKLHSYETFVLESLPVTNISKKAAEWIKKEIKT